MALSAEQQRAEAPQMSSVPDAAMERWHAEIGALKASKRLKWKGVMQNQTGVWSAVRYVPAGVSFQGTRTHFVHKLSAERRAKRGTELDWIPVLSFSAKAAMLNAASKRNVILLAPDGACPMITEGMRSDRLYYTEGEAIQGSDAAVREQIQEQIAANATGNHSARHRPVRVPTAAGQPVRA